MKNKTGIAVVMATAISLFQQESHIRAAQRKTVLFYATSSVSRTALVLYRFSSSVFIRPKIARKNAHKQFGHWTFKRQSRKINHGHL